MAGKRKKEYNSGDTIKIYFSYDTDQEVLEWFGRQKSVSRSLFALLELSILNKVSAGSLSENIVQMSTNGYTITCCSESPLRKYSVGDTISFKLAGKKIEIINWLNRQPCISSAILSVVEASIKSVTPVVNQGNSYLYVRIVDQVRAATNVTEESDKEPTLDVENVSDYNENKQLQKDEKQAAAQKINVRMRPLKAQIAYKG